MSEKVANLVCSKCCGTGGYYEDEEPRDSRLSALEQENASLLKRAERMERALREILAPQVESLAHAEMIARTALKEGEES